MSMFRCAVVALLCAASCPLAAVADKCEGALAQDCLAARCASSSAQQRARRPARSTSVML
jgi:hypothetical protein